MPKDGIGGSESGVCLDSRGLFGKGGKNLPSTAGDPAEFVVAAAFMGVADSSGGGGKSTTFFGATVDGLNGITAGLAGAVSHGVCAVAKETNSKFDMAAKIAARALASFR